MTNRPIIFGAASLIGGVVLAIFDSYIVYDSDPKFRDAPNVALEIGIYAAITLSVIAAVIYWIGEILPKFIISISVGNASVVMLGLSYCWFVKFTSKLIEFLLSEESKLAFAVSWALFLLYPLLVANSSVVTRQNS